MENNFENTVVTEETASPVANIVDKVKAAVTSVVSKVKADPKGFGVKLGAIVLAAIIAIVAVFVVIGALTNNYKTPIKNLLNGVEKENEKKFTNAFSEKMLDETLDVLKPYIKKEVKIPNARFLHDEEAFKVWTSREKKAICIHAELDSSLDNSLVAKEWNRISYEVTKILFSSAASAKKK